MHTRICIVLDQIKDAITLVIYDQSLSASIITWHAFDQINSIF